jgi:hypothetical protein
MMLALLGASYWLQGQDERVAQWIGLMAEKGGAKIKEDTRFKYQWNRMYAALGAEAFNTAVEYGKTLDEKAVLESLLTEMRM